MMSMDLKGKRIATLARFSTDKQDDASIDDQERAIVRFIEPRGGRVAGEQLVFRDVARSGADYATREGLQSLLAAIRGGQVDVVVADSQSRLARKGWRVGQLLDNCKFQGVRVLTVDGKLDTDRDGWELVSGVQGIIDEQQRKQIARETFRSLRAKAEKGHATGRPPFGYKTVPLVEEDGSVVKSRHGKARKDWAIHEEHADVVRILAELMLDPAFPSAEAVAAELNQRGLPHPVGGRPTDTPGWKGPTIREMCRRPIYKGDVVWGRGSYMKDPETDKRTARPAREEPVVKHREDLRIWSDETWEKLYRKASATRGQRQARYHYALSGILRCGECGTGLTVTGSGGAKNKLPLVHLPEREEARALHEQSQRERAQAAGGPALVAGELLHGRLPGGRGGRRLRRGGAARDGAAPGDEEADGGEAASPRREARPAHRARHRRHPLEGRLHGGSGQGRRGAPSAREPARGRGGAARGEQRARGRGARWDRPPEDRGHRRRPDGPGAREAKPSPAEVHPPRRPRGGHARGRDPRGDRGVRAGAALLQRAGGGLDPFGVEAGKQRGQAIVRFRHGSAFGRADQLFVPRTEPACNGSQPTE